MTTDVLGQLAVDLDDAWTNAGTVVAPTRQIPSLSTEQAYQVQEMIVARRLANGREVAGWKLGLTSANPPTTPIVGTLLDDMVISSGSALSVSTMVTPMVEAEFVVQIGETLARPTTAHELAEGPHRVGPGIEVIDYRTVDSQGPVDWIADNSTVAYAVVGDLVPVGEVDPVQVEVSLDRDGEHLASGRGEKVMGNPLEAVAWLSGHLLERGRVLSAGDIILTGSLTGHHQVPSTQPTFTADFGTLGVVSVRFVHDD